jgi:hypothetical protein
MKRPLGEGAAALSGLPMESRIAPLGTVNCIACSSVGARPRPNLPRRQQIRLLTRLNRLTEANPIEAFSERTSPVHTELVAILHELTSPPVVVDAGLTAAWSAGSIAACIATTQAPDRGGASYRSARRCKLRGAGIGQRNFWTRPPAALWRKRTSAGRQGRTGPTLMTRPGQGRQHLLAVQQGPCIYPQARILRKIV